MRQILPSPENLNNVVLYHVLVDVDNHDRQLMTGMSTQMFFQLGAAAQVPLLPLTALGERLPKADTEQGPAYRVKRVTASGESETTVHIGLQNRRFAEVRAGLAVGDQVLPAVKADENGKGGKKDRDFGAPGVPRP